MKCHDGGEGGANKEQPEKFKIAEEASIIYSPVKSLFANQICIRPPSVKVEVKRTSTKPRKRHIERNKVQIETFYIKILL